VYGDRVTVVEAGRTERRWRTAVLAVGGLLIAIAVIGVLGILINRNIHQTVEDAIAFDVELEDRGDDLRVAILEVRHYHRDLLLNNPSPARIERWEEQYAALIDEIDALEALLGRDGAGIDVAGADRLRSMAEAYRADFTDAISRVDDLDAFLAAAEDLLVPIDEMAAIAEAVDSEGERRAASSFVAIDEASATGTLVLVAVLVGLGAVGVVLAYAVLRLIEEQRRVVVAEQQAAAQLAEASRAKTGFIADASHELRTPLTVLRGNAEIGLAIEDDCAHREILVEIVEESVRMSRLVDDLLFLARSDAASVPLELEEAAIGPMLEEIGGRAEVLARERGATLICDLRADAGLARLDTRRVEQAVLALVDNAAKYGPAGGSVELTASSSDGKLEIAVLDRGPGIPADRMERVFERFYRIDDGRRGGSRGGAGLGLSIAAAIVEGHGGVISASNREGGGTVMRLELPLVGPMPAPVVAEPAEAPAGGSA
jgi:signal transduction histidine kinase